jgi:outer membrane protein assembly factor BamB
MRKTRYLPITGAICLLVLTPLITFAAAPVSEAQLDDVKPVPLNPLWRKSLLKSDKEEDTLSKWLLIAEQALGKKGELALPPFIPVAMAGASQRLPGKPPITELVYRSHWGIHAVELDSGKLEWDIPSSCSLQRMLVGGSFKIQLVHQMVGYYLSPSSAQAPHRFAAIFFSNSNYGRLSGGARLVYAIDDLQILPPTEDLTELVLPRSWPERWSTEAEETLSHNRLEAFDIVTGKLIWKWGDDRAAPQPEPESLLEAPITLGDKAYVLSQRKSDLSKAARLACSWPAAVKADQLLWELDLLCLDPARDGRVVSRHFLAQVSGPAYPYGKRMRGAQLVAANQDLVCLSDAGIIIGFDTKAGRIKWSHAYREERDFPPAATKPATAPAVPWLKPGWWELPTYWQTSSVFVAGDRVVFTAADSRSIHCVDLRSGAAVWKQERKDQDQFLAGIVGETVLVAGKNKMRGLRCDTGRARWELTTDTPSGFGAVRGTIYYLPVGGDASKGAEIEAIDASSGKLVARYQTSEKVGNLLFAGDRLVSQTIRDIAVYALPPIKNP